MPSTFRCLPGPVVLLGLLRKNPPLRYLRASLSFGLIWLLTALCPGQLAAPGWPKYLGGLQNLAQGSAAPVIPQVRWQTALPEQSAAASQPAIGPDGTIYCGVSDLNANQYWMAAFDGHNGTLKWRTPIPAPCIAVPALSVDGKLYFGTYGFLGGQHYPLSDNFYALNASTGAILWTVPIGNAISCSATIGVDGTIYFGSSKDVTPNGTFYALDPTLGGTKWSLSAHVDFSLPPAIGPDGTLYLPASTAGQVYALNPIDGSKIWTFTAPSATPLIETAPALAPDGTLYVQMTYTYDGGFPAYRELVAVDSVSGTAKWYFNTNFFGGEFAIAIGPDSSPYYEYDDSLGTELVRLDKASGTILWTVPIGQLTLAPIVGLDGNLYVGIDITNEKPTLACLNAATGTSVWNLDWPTDLGLGSAGVIPENNGAVQIDGSLVYASGNSLVCIESIHVVSLTLNPNPVDGGLTSYGVVTASSAAPQGGFTVSLSSDSAVASVPAIVTIPSGHISATFPVQTIPVDNSSIANISALPSLGVTQALTVQPASLAGITVSPTTVVGGATSTGQVSLGSPAGPSGVIVNLSSNTQTASIPATVTVPAGAVGATFAVKTSGVNAETAATLTASLRDKSSQTVLTIEPASISKLSLNPSTVVGGLSSSATLTLNGAAGPGGTVVAITSNAVVAVVPGTIMVPAGANSTSFFVQTAAVTTSTQAVIQAFLNGVTANATLTVIPATLTSLTLVPTTVAGGVASRGTVTLTGPAATGGLSVQLSSNDSSVVPPASVMVAAGQTTVSFDVKTSPVTTTITAAITATTGTIIRSANLVVTPPALVSLAINPSTVAGATSCVGMVTLSGPATSGGLTVKLLSSSTSVTVPGSAVIAAGQIAATFTVKIKPVTSESVVEISATLGSVTESASLTLLPLWVQSLTLVPSTVAGGTSSEATVTLNGVAPSATVVKLACDTKGVTVPGSVTVPAGQSTAQCTVKTGAVATQTLATLTATLGSSDVPAILTVNPPTLVSISVSPNVVTGGAASTGTVTLSGVAPNGGLTIQLTWDSAAATAPSTLTVPAGKSTASFSLKTRSVSTLTKATITGKLASNSTSALLTIVPTDILSLALNPSSVKGGKTSTGQIVLTAPAPPGGAIVTLTSSTGDATVPTTATIAAGATKGSFAIQTVSVKTKATATITATVQTSKTAVLTIQ